MGGNGLCNGSKYRFTAWWYFLQTKTFLQSLKKVLFLSNIQYLSVGLRKRNVAQNKGKELFGIKKFTQQMHHDAICWNISEKQKECNFCCDEKDTLMLQGVTVATKSQKDPRGPRFRDLIKGEIKVIESHTEDS